MKTRHGKKKLITDRYSIKTRRGKEKLITDHLENLENWAEICLKFRIFFDLYVSGYFGSNAGHYF